MESGENKRKFKEIYRCCGRSTFKNLREFEKSMRKSIKTLQLLNQTIDFKSTARRQRNVWFLLRGQPSRKVNVVLEKINSSKLNVNRKGTLVLAKNIYGYLKFNRA